MKFPFFTIGHSTRPIGEFIDLLTASEIGIVVDVRTVPRSRTNPQYNREALPESLSGFQIAYEHVAELGGLRARAKNIAPDVNAFWQNQSFHNYADYAMSGRPGCKRYCWSQNTTGHRCSPEYVMRALNRHVERVFDPSRKDTHWGRRKLKRDECGGDGSAFWRRVLA